MKLSGLHLKFGQIEEYELIQGLEVVIDTNKNILLPPPPPVELFPFTVRTLSNAPFLSPSFLPPSSSYHLSFQFPSPFASFFIFLSSSWLLINHFLFIQILSFLIIHPFFHTCWLQTRSQTFYIQLYQSLHTCWLQHVARHLISSYTTSFILAGCKHVARHYIFSYTSAFILAGCWHVARHFISNYTTGFILAGCRHVARHFISNYTTGFILAWCRHEARHFISSYTTAFILPGCRHVARHIQLFNRWYRRYLVSFLCEYMQWNRRL